KPQDASLIVAYINGQQVPNDPTNGATYDPGSNSLVFHGTSCDQIKAGGASNLDVVYGGPQGPLQIAGCRITLAPSPAPDPDPDPHPGFRCPRPEESVEFRLCNTHRYLGRGCRKPGWGSGSGSGPGSDRLEPDSCVPPPPAQK